MNGYRIAPCAPKYQKDPSRRIELPVLKNITCDRAAASWVLGPVEADRRVGGGADLQARRVRGHAVTTAH